MPFVCYLLAPLLLTSVDNNCLDADKRFHRFLDISPKERSLNNFSLEVTDSPKNANIIAFRETKTAQFSRRDLKKSQTTFCKWSEIHGEKFISEGLRQS